MPPQQPPHRFELVRTYVDSVKDEIKAEVHKVEAKVDGITHIADKLDAINLTLIAIKDRGLSLIYIIVIGAFGLAGVKNFTELFK